MLPVHPARAGYDCEQAQRLPAEADEESRRIACEIPEKYRSDVAMAEFIGRLIRLHDSAAWVTTDALQAAHAFGDQSPGRGWLTLARDDGNIDVRYFSEQDGQVVAFASASLDVEAFKARDAHKLAPPEPMTEREQRLMRARNLALATPELRVCTDHAPNTVIVESDDDGRREILVFVMSAWVNVDEAPLGGYHMFRVSPDGNTVLSLYSQTKACPMASGAASKQAQALTVTHLTSAAPTMFHVFMSLQYRKPLYVSTTQNGLLWRVERGQVFLVPTGNESPAAETSFSPGS
jgi:hypothetical protein